MLQFSPAGLPEEAAAAARLIHDSDPAYYDFWFGSPADALQSLTALWQAPDGSLSHVRFSVWREDGAIVMLASHYPARVAAQLAAADELAQRCLHGDLAGLQSREARLAWLFPHLPEDAWYLRTLAVGQDRRGSGLGSQALAAVVQAAREAGASAVHVDVDSANPRAVQFYRAHGFGLLVETRVPMLEPYRLPASCRLAKPLA